MQRYQTATNARFLEVQSLGGNAKRLNPSSKFPSVLGRCQSNTRSKVPCEVRLVGISTKESDFRETLSRFDQTPRSHASSCLTEQMTVTQARL